ncbi:MAG: hypothetical protein BGO12_12650 [Verrucomicrobia bacterium 61-8]|nr:hypothetical protein [Verrucomicrobiota bacterium]OJU97586.1 MAG: hypothetical protein BGO12_12650 [Verrucomicrobia bacterium 61-8]
MNAIKRPAALGMIGVIFIFSGCDKPRVTQRFPLASGVSIDILEETEWEYSPKLLYTVREHDAVRVQPTFFDVVGSEELRMMDSGKVVVGFVRTSEPSSVVILFDQRTRESWPGGPAGESREEAHERGERMLGVLREAFPHEGLILKN